MPRRTRPFSPRAPGDDRMVRVVRGALIAVMQGLPRQLARSVTWDQGTKLARHHEFTAATGTPVYFCDPHSPWQHGTAENTNGLLRQYFPRATDLSGHSRADLDEVAAEVNDRPRRFSNGTPGGRPHHADRPGLGPRSPTS
jgi:IS30 family transposase